MVKWSVNIGIILHRRLHVEVSRVLSLIKASQKGCEKEKARPGLRASFTATLMGKSNHKAVLNKNGQKVSSFSKSKLQNQHPTIKGRCNF